MVDFLQKLGRIEICSMVTLLAAPESVGLSIRTLLASVTSQPHPALLVFF